MSNIKEVPLVVIECRADGTAQCLHTDAIPLRELGKLSMERASRIEWCEADQQWAVLIDEMPAPKLMYCAPSRQDCLEWERNYFNYAILNQ